MNDILLNSWIGYLMDQCGNDDHLCPRKGCPMMSAEECRAYQDYFKKIVKEHGVMNAAVAAINQVKKERADRIKD